MVVPATESGILHVYREGLRPTDIRMLESLDSGTQLHSVRVGSLATSVVRSSGMIINHDVTAAFYLHDIAKSVPPFRELACSPNVFTREEEAVMRWHPVVGHKLLLHKGMPNEAARLVRWHHEKYNGTGYPDGLKGEEIPLLVAVLTAADVFDAMVDNHRGYRKPCDLETALRRLKALGGTELNPTAVEMVLNTFPLWGSNGYTDLLKLENNSF